MIIYIGADHRGFQLNGKLVEMLKDGGYEMMDVGAAALDANDDFPRYAAAVAQKVSLAPDQARGIMICGSGFGMDIVANKFKNVRSALAMSPDHIYQARHDDNVNILALAANFVDEDAAIKIVKVFLSTPFAADERYARRVGEISEIESHQQ